MGNTSEKSGSVRFTQNETIERIEREGLMVPETFHGEGLRPTGSDPMPMNHTRHIVTPPEAE